MALPPVPELVLPPVPEEVVCSGQHTRPVPQAKAVLGAWGQAASAVQLKLGGEPPVPVFSWLVPPVEALLGLGSPTFKLEPLPQAAARVTLHKVIQRVMTVSSGSSASGVAW